jgi:hypothetical protein
MDKEIPTAIYDTLPKDFASVSPLDMQKNVDEIRLFLDRILR